MSKVFCIDFRLAISKESDGTLDGSSTMYEGVDPDKCRENPAAMEPKGPLYICLNQAT